MEDTSTVAISVGIFAAVLVGVFLVLGVVCGVLALVVGVGGV